MPKAKTQGAITKKSGSTDLAAEVAAAAPCRREIMPFARFVEQKAKSRNPSLLAFTKKYGLAYQTLQSYCSGKSYPTDLRVLGVLAAALQKESGEQIGLITLLRLIYDIEDAIAEDAITGNSKLTAAKLREEYGSLGSEKDLIDQYKKTPFDAKLTVVPELQRLIADDIELATSDNATVLAILIKKECESKNIGISKLADAIGVESSLLQAAVKKQPIRASFEEISKMALAIKDERGNYGNLSRFLKLTGWENVHIKTVVDKFMAEKSLSSIEGVVDSLLKSGGSKKITAKKRLDIIAAFEEMLESDELMSVSNPAYEAIIPELARQLGFDGAEQLAQFIAESKDGAHSG